MKRLLFPISILLILAIASCKKNYIQEKPAPPLLSDTTNNIRVVLAGSQLHIFYAALKKTGLDTLLHADKAFTIFAPTDAAFTAYGITAGSLDNLSTDSLSKLLQYHIVRGAFAYEGISSAVKNFTAPCLLKTTFFDSTKGYSVYQQRLFLLGRDHALMINGDTAGNGEAPLAASNGYLYAIDKILQPPTRTLYQLIKSRPELSYFLRACQLNDSIYRSYQYDIGQMDSSVFSRVNYNTEEQTSPITLLAPIDNAFLRSPFNNEDELRNYANQWHPTAYGYTMLDALLRMHIVSGGSSGVLTGSDRVLLYNDLMGIPNINNGIFNITNRFPDLDYNTYLYVYYYLQYQRNNGVLDIRWGDDFLNGPAHILSTGKNIMALNGVIHEVDSLFYIQTQ